MSNKILLATALSAFVIVSGCTRTPARPSATPSSAPPATPAPTATPFVTPPLTSPSPEPTSSAVPLTTPSPVIDPATPFPTPTESPQASSEPKWKNIATPEEFTLDVPDGWLVMTTAERDDASAREALKAQFPALAGAIDSTAQLMAEQDQLLNALDADAYLDGDGLFNVVLTRHAFGPTDWLSPAMAQADADQIARNMSLAQSPTPAEIALPEGAFRYAYAQDASAPVPMGGVVYLVPVGDAYYRLELTCRADALDAQLPLAQHIVESLVISIE